MKLIDQLSVSDFMVLNAVTCITREAKSACSTIVLICLGINSSNTLVSKAGMSDLFLFTTKFLFQV